MDNTVATLIACITIIIIAGGFIYWYSRWEKSPAPDEQLSPPELEALTRTMLNGDGE